MIQQAASIIRNAKRVTAFTGAGISVESGIPPFRGEGGLWETYDPGMLDIHHFKSNPAHGWKLIKELFYDFFGKARPNRAHEVLAEMESKGFLHTVITQNIDNLHQDAGSREVYEYHGTSSRMVCMSCDSSVPSSEVDLGNLPPRCTKCKGALKPDFVFFGEPIPHTPRRKADEEARKSDVFLVIGTTGEVVPASMIPYAAKENGATIIEINTRPSNYTNRITDVFLEGKATEMMDLLMNELNNGG